MTEPNITDREKTFSSEFETLLNKSDLPAAMKEAMLKQVAATVANAGEATAVTLQNAIDQGAQNYLAALQEDVRLLRERGTFYKPLYQTSPNNGSNAALFQAMDSIRSLNQTHQALSDEGDAQRELMAFKPEANALIKKSGFSK